MVYLPLTKTMPQVGSNGLPLPGHALAAEGLPEVDTFRRRGLVPVQQHEAEADFVMEPAVGAPRRSKVSAGVGRVVGRQQANWLALVVPAEFHGGERRLRRKARGEQ